MEQPDACAEGAKSCRNNADNAVKRGAEVAAKVVGGVVTGAACGAAGGAAVGVGIVLSSLVVSGATCLEPTACGAGFTAIVAGGAVIGAVVGAVVGAKTMLREIESTRPAKDMSLLPSCGEAWQLR